MSVRDILYAASLGELDRRLQRVLDEIDSELAHEDGVDHARLRSLGIDADLLHSIIEEKTNAQEEARRVSE